MTIQTIESSEQHWSRDAEEGVLGAMLIDSTAIDVSAERLTKNCFYLENHRNLFQAVIDLYEKGTAIDPITLSDQLEANGTIRSVGGRSAVTDIFGSVPTAAHIEHHVKIVEDKFLIPQLRENCRKILNETESVVDDVSDLIDQAERDLLEVQSYRVKGGAENIRPIMNRIIDDIEYRQSIGKTMTGIPSGLIDLDRKTIGFQRSDLIILAGRPAMGKTALALKIALNVALEETDERCPVAIFSMEMSKEQLTQRLMSIRSGVTVSAMRQANLGDKSWENLHLATNELYDANIHIDDTPALTALELRAKARRLSCKEGIGRVVVDYLQLMSGSRSKGNREQEISEISRSLKALAKELNVPVIALSQLSRAVELRADKRPHLSDLRESGAIEQDADLVLMLYRPEVYGILVKEDQDTRGTAELLIEKNRSGATGKLGLRFKEETTDFNSLFRIEDLKFDNKVQ